MYSLPTTTTRTSSSSFVLVCSHQSLIIVKKTRVSGICQQRKYFFQCFAIVAGCRNQDLRNLGNPLYHFIFQLSDYPSGFCVCVGEERRLVSENSDSCCFFILNDFYTFQHLFASQHRDDVTSQCNAVAIENIGVGIKVSRQTITLRDFYEHKFGKCG